ncbi:MAG: XdhC family protein [Hyphomicrobium sp.]|nr:XdhC family protein [Hyphomicrobium sp.]
MDKISESSFGQTSSDNPSAFVENVLPYLRKWRDRGQRTALVTLVGKDGSSPRPIGSQLAVSEQGDAVGYIASDCLGQALIEEAKAVIEKEQNQLVRFGKGSQYIDIKLPCGSGLDIYFDQALGNEQLDEMLYLQRLRLPFVLRTEFQCGRSLVQRTAQRPDNRPRAKQTHICRYYYPTPQLLVAGTGPATYYISILARNVGFDAKVITPDTALLMQLHREGLRATGIAKHNDQMVLNLDAFSAAILAFHDHDWELDLLIQILEREVFYVGAVGSARTHRERLSKLEQLGIPESKRARIVGPVGIVRGARSPTEIAISILAEIMAEARRREILC